MNIVRELRKKKGIQQKELAIAIGVSRPTVSDWEANKKDPSGERLKKLAEYFDVDELFILGVDKQHPYTPAAPNISGVSETEQIVQYVLDRLNNKPDPGVVIPKTREARIVSGGIDKLPKEKREQVLNVFRAMFASNPEIFEDKGNDDDET